MNDAKLAAINAELGGELDRRESGGRGISAGTSLCVFLSDRGAPSGCDYEHERYSVCVSKGRPGKNPAFYQSSCHLTENDVCEEWDSGLLDGVGTFLETRGYRFQKGATRREIRRL